MIIYYLLKLMKMLHQYCDSLMLNLLSKINLILILDMIRFQDIKAMNFIISQMTV
jgi:hypothetical protein